MTGISSGTTVAGGLGSFGLSVIHGIVLTVILIGLYRVRSWLLFVKVLIGLVIAFFLFLLIDGIISGPLSADAGLLCGAGLALIGGAIYGRAHRTRDETW
jgi:hypothetical protein